MQPCALMVARLQSYDFVELWAGHAVTSSVIRKAGRNTAALDITYFKPDPDHPHRSNHFDILTPSGFLPLASMDAIILFNKIGYLYTYGCL